MTPFVLQSPQPQSAGLSGDLQPPVLSATGVILAQPCCTAAA